MTKAATDSAIHAAIADPSPAGIAEAISFAASHGVVVSQALNSAPGTNMSHAPMTYLPSPFDASSYRLALRIAAPLNTLLARLASDHAYLRTALAETATADPFTGRLLQLLGTAPPGGVELSIVRTDYFVHKDASRRSPRMVEVNCIAASFGCLGCNTSRMHRFLARHPAVGADIDPSALPPNNSTRELARGLATAHAEYNKRHGLQSNLQCVAVLVCQPGERNAYDQDLLRNELWEAHQVEMLRMSLVDVCASGRLNEEGELCVTPAGRDGAPLRVSVVYYRAGYTPNDYPSEKEWAARAVIEKSLAAKCPTVAMQLVGTKKIQQVLDQPGEVERFVDDPQEAADIRATFARQYSLSAAEDGEKVAQMAIDRPDDFVLKPQREGGGNNLYGTDLKEALIAMSLEERSAYVLMERIRPVVVRNVMIRDGQYSVNDIVSEFGVFGVHLSSAGNVVLNLAAGTLLRSKAASQDDGGVAAGVAVLDSPLLIE